MPYNFTVSPDFTPNHLSGWFIFNTWLQRVLDEAIHLELFDNFFDQRQAIQADKVDLIFANPYDAAMLVRHKGFTPLTKPEGKADEAIIAVNSTSGAECVEDLQPGVNVATTDDPDVHMMGLIMLEPADLDTQNIHLSIKDSFVLVAKDIIRGDCEVGIFLAEAYNDLSSIAKDQLRMLVKSEIQVIHHSLMVGPRLAHKRDSLIQVLTSMTEDSKGKGVLQNLGFSGWKVVNHEESEFMIDLIDTLMV